MITGIPVADLIAMTTHDGTGRGFIAEEFFYGLYKLNWIICPIYSDLLTYQEDKEILVDYSVAFADFKNSHDLLICGKGRVENRHAIAWCSTTQKYYDPNGFVTEETTLLPECAYALLRNNPQNPTRG